MKSQLAAASLSVLLVATAYGAGDVAEAPDPKDAFRPLWTRSIDTAYVETWWISKPFSNATANISATDDALDRDHLLAQGGEVGVRRPETDENDTWRPVTVPGGHLKFEKLLGSDALENAIVYAFTPVVSARAADAVLALGSDDSIKVWLNGSVVHEHRVQRGVRADQDLIPITLNAGTNTLLCKVENEAGPWGLIARVLTPAEANGLPERPWAPRLDSSVDNALVVETDPGASLRTRSPARRVLARARTGDGRVLGTVTVASGSTITWSTQQWPDGPYEVVLTRDEGDGTSTHRYLKGMHGDWESVLHAMLDVADAAHRTTRRDPDVLVMRILRDIVLHHLKSDPRESTETPSWGTVHAALMEWQRLGRSVEERVLAQEMFRLAWIDPIDDSPQFARMYLPPGYTPEKRWPLVVNLHGYNPKNPKYPGWWSVTQAHDADADRFGVITLHPHGRGNTGYRGLGETDVLRAIREARKVASVDADRIYLTGYSMGGGGTWHVGSRNTHIFAALAPVYGGWDYHVWLEPERFASLDTLDRFRQEAWSSFACAESLLNTPVFVNHGDADAVVDVEHSRYAVALLQRWGYDLRYWEHPGKGHGRLGETRQTIPWMLGHTLQRMPNEVRLRATALSDAHADWVQVTQIENPYAVTQLRARIADGTLQVDSENVLELWMWPPHDGLAEGWTQRVMWNGRLHAIEASGSKYRLRAAGYAPKGLVKRPALSGPMRDAQNTPFAIVVGTQSQDPNMHRFCAMHAEATYRSWQEWQHAAPRFFLDTEITEEQTRRYSLLLYGGPDENLVARALWKHLPLDISDGTVQIDGTRFEAPDAAVGLAYPHPLNPGRYVVVRAGTSARGMYFANVLDDGDDFAITDARIDPDPEHPSERLDILRGRFDAHWRFDAAYAHRGDAALREDAELRKAPRLLNTDVPGKRLYLSDVLASRAGGSFQHVRRDRNWQYERLRIGRKTYRTGIGVEVWNEPCWAEFDIAGHSWTRLRAVLGIELPDADELEDAERKGTGVRFVVSDGDVELYRSRPFGVDGGREDLDLDISTVKALRLSVENASTWNNAARSVNWAELRLER